MEQRETPQQNPTARSATAKSVAMNRVRTHHHEIVEHLVVWGQRQTNSGDSCSIMWRTLLHTSDGRSSLRTDVGRQPESGAPPAHCDSKIRNAARLVNQQNNTKDLNIASLSFLLSSFIIAPCHETSLTLLYRVVYDYEIAWVYDYEIDVVV